MAKPSRAATGPKQELFKFPEDLDLDLKAFCEAHHGAPKTRIVQDALRAFMDSELADQPRLRARFNEARKRLAQNALPTVRLLKADSVDER